jgi:putative peptidoglycan lipid II flippase
VTFARPAGGWARTAGHEAASRSTAHSSATVAAWTVVSRATGLLRVVVIGAVLGPTFVANSFVATNNVPNLTYSAVAGPVLGLVVVPGMVRVMLQCGPLACGLHVRRLSGLVLTASGVLAVLLLLASPLVAWTLTLGVPDADLARARLIVLVLVVLVAPQVLLYSIAALGAAAQQAREHYALAAAAPATENIGLMVTMAVVAHLQSPGTDVGTTQFRLVAIMGAGATLSVAVHAGIQAAGAGRLGLPLHPAWNWRADPDVREVASRLRRSVVVAGLPAASVYLFLAVAATIPGGVVVFQAAYLVYGVPTALGARAVTTAVLPGMSAAVTAGDDRRYATLWRQALFYGTVAALPALCALAVLAVPIADVLAAGALHRPALIAALAVCIGVLSISQLPGGLWEIGRQALFATLDVRGPQIAGWIAFAATVAGSGCALLLPAGIPRLAGLAAAVLLTDLAAFTTVFVLVRRHVRPEPSVDWRRLRTALCAAAAMLPVLGVGLLLTRGLDRLHELAVVLASVAAATAVFAAVLFLTRPREGREPATGCPMAGRASEVGTRAPAVPRVPAWESAARRVLDAAISASVLLLLAIPLLGIALWVRLDSPGPALLRQERIGRGRSPFTLYKFRSMRVGGDDGAHHRLIEAELRGENTRCDGSTKLCDDPRVTPPGRFLRRTSLDEVPQLLNVLRGDMSLVGPRPCLPWEAEMFPPAFAERFDVLPGVTGLWQVSGRSTLGTLDMLRYDLVYVRSRSIGGDLRILLLTIPTVLRGSGAR